MWSREAAAAVGAGPAPGGDAFAGGWGAGGGGRFPGCWFSRALWSEMAGLLPALTALKGESLPALWAKGS